MKEYYYIEIYTNEHHRRYITDYTFDTKEEMQDFINTLTDEEKENIATIYKYTETENNEYPEGEQAWNDFIL